MEPDPKTTKLAEELHRNLCSVCRNPNYKLMEYDCDYWWSGSWKNVLVGEGHGRRGWYDMADRILKNVNYALTVDQIIDLIRIIGKGK